MWVARKYIREINLITNKKHTFFHGSMKINKYKANKVMNWQCKSFVNRYFIKNTSDRKKTLIAIDTEIFQYFSHTHSFWKLSEIWWWTKKAVSFLAYFELLKIGSCLGNYSSLKPHFIPPRQFVMYGNNRKYFQERRSGDMGYEGAVHCPIQ